MAAETPESQPHWFSTRLADVLAPVLTLILLLIAWQAIVTIGQIRPILLPGPNSVLSAATRMAPQLAQATLRTSLAAMCGLMISTCIGVLTAFVFSQSALIRRALYPYAVLIQTVPIIAVAPIIIVTCGRGFLSISLIAAIISLFPIITNTTTGLLQTDAGLLELFRLHHATRWQTLFKLRLPSSLPYLIAGVRIAGGAAIVGAIVGEFFVSDGQTGLGSLIQTKFAAFNLSELYATVLTAALLGTTFFAAITVIGEFILQRWFGMSMSGRRS